MARPRPYSICIEQKPFSGSSRHGRQTRDFQVDRDSRKGIREFSLAKSGYGAFSIGQSGVEEVKSYIINQAKLHRVKSFEEELRTFLKRYQIEFDERYVWD
jgi:hypothetical protein